MRACVRACVRGRMVQWFVQSISNRNIPGSITAECRYTRLSSPSLSLGGYKQPNEYGSVCCGKKRNCVAGQKQPLEAMWYKTRLVNSGGQFDLLCNLMDGVILAQVVCHVGVSLLHVLDNSVTTLHLPRQSLTFYFR